MIKLPEIGMFLGLPVYLDRADYIFQHSGKYYTSWVSEDRSPEWYLEKIKEDNQGNLAVIWDGGSTKVCLKSMADFLDLKSLGYDIPEPDWKNRKFLVPEDWPVIKEHMDRYGAGLLRFVEKASELGLYSYAIYADATRDIGNRIAGKDSFLGLNIGEVFAFDLETDEEAEFREKKIRMENDFDLEIIADRLKKNIEKFINDRKTRGWNRFLLTSASFHIDFETAAAGSETIPHVECFAFNNLNFGMSLCRGIYNQFKLPLWGAYLAHEHYSFLPYSSEHKFRMLDTAFLLSYMNGSKVTVQESGSFWQQSDHVEDTPMHDTPKIDLGSLRNKNPRDYAHLVEDARKHYPLLNYDSEICRKYRKCQSDFYDFVKSNGTPDGQPEANLAAIKGRYDFSSQSFSPNSAVASAYKIAEKNPLWYEGMPERGWEIFRKTFHPLDNTLGIYNNLYFSGTPYGMTDIVSFAAQLPSASFLKKYKALVFTGWNTASDEQYTLLKEYVHEGGILFAGIPHFSKNKNRNYVAYGADELVNGGDLSELCGVKVKKRGVQMYWALAAEGNEFGWKKHRHFGPFCTHMGEIEITGNPHVIAVHDESYAPYLLMNRYGKGKVYFLNSWEYPGALDIEKGPSSPNNSNGIVGETYKAIALQARGEAYITDDGKTPGVNCDHIVFSNFPEAGKFYLLNIDFSSERKFNFHRKGGSRTISLKPLEFKQV